MRWLLSAIFLLGFLLRVVAIDKYPIGFNADEASHGYDAYSLLTTGRDQWGKPFPLAFKSFGDYKSPLYTYLTLPSVAVFGLNTFAVRLPNAIVGTLAIMAIWLLTTKLINRKTGLIAAFLLAVSPWHIMMSRGAFEGNLITFFLPLGIYLFLIKKYNLSAFVFGLTLFTYHSAKLITPIVFIALLIVFRVKKLVPIALFSIAFLLMLYANFLGGGKRIAERSIFVGALEAGAGAKIALIQKGANPVVARLLHNKYQVTAQRFIVNYKQYFSSRFLFTGGAGEASYGMIPGIGVIYIFEGLLLIGLIPLFWTKWRNTVVMLILWLLVAPLPAALATGVGYSGNRAEGMLPVLQILAAIGVLGWLGQIKKVNKKVVFIIFAAFLVFSGNRVYNFFRSYYQIPVKAVAQGMLYGNLEMASWLNQNGNGREIVVSRSLSEPQIFIAFASKWDPRDYQKSTEAWNYEAQDVLWLDQMENYSLGNYTFGSFTHGTLLVGRPGDFSGNITPEKVIYYPDGSPAIYAKIN
jgi:4-amino-4-deoxy-L-arabinose transferase-like glycosyltransferase